MVLRIDYRMVLALLMIVLGATSGCHRQGVFYTEVTGERRPWTHLDFNNDPAAFQFAVVSDNTGGSRAGVFASAVDKLNLLQPEFVISVGDLIEGYTEDREQLEKEWAEFEAMVGQLAMPFFYVAGNHDVTNAVMTQLWKEKFGRHYYAFVYRDVLFLILDTQDGGAGSEAPYHNKDGLSAAQVAWAQATLAAHEDVRYTMVIMHQPLWKHAAGGRAQISFGQVEAALAGREYMVICGHHHRYTYHECGHHVYVVLATTGGASQLRGVEYGEFDQAVWVTMTPDGPQIANLLLDGILPVDVFHEADLERLEKGQ